MVDQPQEGDDHSAPAGRVSRDAQGNAVWEWATSAGRQALDSTSRLLRRLDVPGLKLLDEGGGPEAGNAATPAQRAEQGFNPYEGGAAPRATSQVARAPPAKPAV